MKKLSLEGKINIANKAKVIRDMSIALHDDVSNPFASNIKVDKILADLETIKKNADNAISQLTK